MATTQSSIYLFIQQIPHYDEISNPNLSWYIMFKHVEYTLFAIDITIDEKSATIKWRFGLRCDVSIDKALSTSIKWSFFISSHWFEHVSRK